ncbi:MAG: O-antigen ligase family protein [Candidatus Hydrogenedentota bacterium]
MDTDGRLSTRAMVRLVLCMVLAAGIAVGLVVFADCAPQLILELPLGILALTLLAVNSQWALCLAAFAIMPLGDVRREVFDVTVNFPEVLIHAIVAKEFVRFVLHRESLQRIVPLWPVLFFAGTALLGVVTGHLNQTSPKHVLQDFRQFSEFIVLFLLVVQRVRSRQQVMQLLTCFTIGATVVAVHGILQRHTGMGVSPEKIASDIRLYHAIRSGSLYGATALGGLMVLTVAPAIGVALTTKSRLLKLCIAVCLVLCLLVTIYTKTRASWFAMVLAILYIAAFIRPGMRTLAVTALCVLFLGALVGPTLVDRLSTLSTPKEDTSLMERAQYYTAAAHIATAHPLLGLGWGCYYDIDTILQQEEYVDVPRPPDAPDATVHSAYLQLLVKTGVIGLVGFLSVVFVWFERLWSAQHTAVRQSKEHVLTVCIGAGIAGYLAHSAFENFFQWGVMAQSFWLLLGLSLVMADFNAPRTRRYKTPILVAGVLALTFAGFMYACVRLESFHTEHYEHNVARALAAGNIQKARDIARRAVDHHFDDPMAPTVYGRLLLDTGNAGAALEQLDAAFDMYRAKGQNTLDTGARYYFAPARLTLGRYCMDKGRPRAAVAQFELARAYADLTAARFARFHETIYQAYAAQGQWRRALAFREPAASEIGRLEAGDLLALAQVAEGGQRWPLIRRLSDRLMNVADDIDPVHFYIGRALLGMDHPETAMAYLQAASDAGQPGAAYFLGRTFELTGDPEAAVRAYNNAPADDNYRVFALARAHAVLKQRPETSPPLTVLSDAVLRESIAQHLARMHPVPPPGDENNDGRAFTLLRYAVPPGALRHGGPFPMLLLWKNNSADTPPSAATFPHLDTYNNSLYIYLDTRRVLELRWVENLVNWTSVARGRPGERLVPGWIDTMHDWFEIRETPATRVRREADGNQVLGIDLPTWVYSVPVRVETACAYLLAGRIASAPECGALGWQFIDAESAVRHEEDLPPHASQKAGTWHTGFAWTQPGWHALRVCLTHGPPGGTAVFDDLLLVALEAPSTGGTPTQ